MTTFRHFFLAVLAAGSAMNVSAADYDVIIENMPNGFAVNIDGKRYAANTDVSLECATFSSAKSLSHDMISATARNGWVPTVRIDDVNHQIGVSYQKLFDTVADVNDPNAKGYYISETGNNVYVKFVDPNITANDFTGDRFLFLEDGDTGKYYIYNKNAGHYIYYVEETATANVQTTSASMVRYTTDREKANTWKIVADDLDGYVDFVPGCVENVTDRTQGWNFRGGKKFALNLYDRSDSNSHWFISGTVGNVVNCATHVFSLPGKPFMHKLIANEGERITSVSGLPAGLSLDMTSRSYPFVYGTAPEVGDYTYTLNLNEGTDNELHVDVTFNVAENLNQPTPFMGILTWNAFDKHIDQQKIMKIADALEDFGLYELGYDHMCIDDCWALRNRENNHYALNPEKFYDLKALCDYVHAKGMKIGIYSDAADRTCSSSMPGSYGYEDIDATDFVNWGFDLLKYDYCFAPADAKSAETRYRAMYDALSRAQQAAGKRPEDFMLYICEWGWRSPWIWGAETGATCWRATDDTREFWSDTTYRGGILQSIDVFKKVWQYTGVNRWNDADMLVVGLHGTGYSSNDGGGDGYLPGLTIDEAKTNFALWCMWSSPLILSNNITNLDGKPNDLTGKTVTNTHYKKDLEIIRNKHLIALDQDPLGQCAEPIVDAKSHIIFAKDLANGDVALSFTNLSGNTKYITLDLGIVPGLEAGASYEVLDLWRDAAKVGEITTHDTYEVRVTKHNTAVVRLHKVDAASLSNLRAEVSSVATYDLAGRRVASSASGITVSNGLKTLR